MKNISEYNGNIRRVCRWDQELLGYHVSILHQSERMMRDVDAISRRFGLIISSYTRNASVLSDTDRNIDQMLTLIHYMI